MSRNNWDGEPSGYAQNPENLILLNILLSQFEVEILILQTPILG